VRYGGCGTPDVDTDDGWHVPGEAAVVLVPGPQPPGYDRKPVARQGARKKEETERKE